MLGVGSLVSVVAGDYALNALHAQLPDKPVETPIIWVAWRLQMMGLFFAIIGAVGITNIVTANYYDVTPHKEP